MTRAPGAFLLAFLGAGCSHSDLLSGWKATEKVLFAFDVDLEEGVHGDVEIEWWYHWGFLTDEAGGAWAWVSSFFRWTPRGNPTMRYQLYDLMDLKTGKRDYHSRIGSEAMASIEAWTRQGRAPPHDQIPGAPAEKPGDRLRLVYDPDLLERTGPRTYRLRCGGIDVELRAVAAAIPVEGNGLTGVHRREDMRYYTLPRLEASGTVRGRKATGLFWYDHQWGSSWVGPAIGWSWWGLQLEDGTSVNAYVLRDVKTGKPHRSVLTRDFRAYPLEARPLDWWTSPTNVRTPISWELEGGGLLLRVEPFNKERECPIPGVGGSIWEGPVRVTGTVGGLGFQELVGYARERSR